ncbi:MAG: hypothetical protein ACLQQ4_05475 [Bacteroidia bacterium]
MKRLEFNTTIHNGIIEVLKNNPEIKDKEVKVIIMWEEKPAAKTKKINARLSDWKEKIYKIIDAGADISSFGDINEWQRITRADRNINLKGI